MDKKLFRSLLLLITFTVLLILVIVKFDVLWGAVASVLTVCRPLFIGLAIASPSPAPFSAATWTVCWRGLP